MVLVLVRCSLRCGAARLVGGGTGLVSLGRGTRAGGARPCALCVVNVNARACLHHLFITEHVNSLRGPRTSAHLQRRLDNFGETFTRLREFRDCVVV